MPPAPDELARRALAWGVETSWEDVHRERHAVPAQTLQAILDALGADGPAPPGRGPVVVRRSSGAGGAPGRSPRLPAGELVLEDGTTLPVDGRLPDAVPLGYHRLRPRRGEERTVIVSPGRCHLPPGRRDWGWAAQLYSVRSAHSWGMGDLGDLAVLGEWAAELGAAWLLLNPLHFATPVPPVIPSPYSPSSRRFRDPLSLRIADVPGAAAVAEELEPLRREGELLRTSPRIDRDLVMSLKMAALERIWRQQGGSAEFEAWRAAQGADLDAFGTYCALSERYGARWPAWPASLQRRDSAAVARETAALRPRATFHAWLQWLVDLQLGAAAQRVSLLHDLAIGVDPGGVDAWLWPDAIAQGIHVGAPPDLFNTLGQDWGIAPFDPWGLRAAAYAPFAEVLRACMRGSGGLRIDHVMGLSRLFWIPPGATPRDGAYVRYPAADLFDVLALESVRASALVVGEDLGTVQPLVRREMNARDVLSYRLLWFEARPPRGYPERALAAVSTHDLPTVAGVWTGADLRAQQEAGTQPDEARNRALRDRLAALAGLPEGASVEDAVLGAYRALSAAPSAILMATLEDGLAVEARPNMPGTSPEQWPSWSMALPRTLEEIRTLELPRRLAEVLRRRP
ncbi:MAG TPA: 4-alpha-glucanotransferase [Candidatus Dormibacteraeota bacterium]|jgi:4-alpha-glucanotransferase|nr:4-alpha-glucanotransferase [Candidatus Dormibacteraeota bacterium]